MGASGAVERVWKHPHTARTLSERASWAAVAFPGAEHSLRNACQQPRPRAVWGGQREGFRQEAVPAPGSLGPSHLVRPLVSA